MERFLRFWVYVRVVRAVTHGMIHNLMAPDLFWQKKVIQDAKENALIDCMVFIETNRHRFTNAKTTSH